MSKDGSFSVTRPIDGEFCQHRQRLHRRLQMHLARAGQGVPRRRRRQWRHVDRGPAGPARRRAGADAPELCPRSGRSQALRHPPDVMDTLSIQRSHGGTQRVVRHASRATGTDMTLSVFVPPGEAPVRRLAGADVPVGPHLHPRQCHGEGRVSRGGGGAGPGRDRARHEPAWARRTGRRRHRAGAGRGLLPRCHPAALGRTVRDGELRRRRAAAGRRRARRPRPRTAGE